MTEDELRELPLSERIEALRRQAGSHDKLAAALGTRRGTIIRWEKGAQPSDEYVTRLADYTGLPADLFATPVVSVEQRLAEALEALRAELATLADKLDRRHRETHGLLQEAGEAAQNNTNAVLSLQRQVDALERGLREARPVTRRARAGS